MNFSAKSKIVRKKSGSESQGSDVERAMRQLRRLRRESSSGKQLDVVVSDGLVVVKAKVPNARIDVTLGDVVREKAKREYRAYLGSLSRQMKIASENSRNDSERIVRTLREKPSDEALQFYESITQG
jgi:hypothetical protein